MFHSLWWHFRTVYPLLNSLCFLSHASFFVIQDRLSRASFFMLIFPDSLSHVSFFVLVFQGSLSHASFSMLVFQGCLSHASCSMLVFQGSLSHASFSMLVFQGCLSHASCSMLVFQGSLSHASFPVLVRWAAFCPFLQPGGLHQYHSLVLEGGPHPNPDQALVYTAPDDTDNNNAMLAFTIKHAAKVSWITEFMSS